MWVGTLQQLAKINLGVLATEFPHSSSRLLSETLVSCWIRNSPLPGTSTSFFVTVITSQASYMLSPVPSLLVLLSPSFIPLSLLELTLLLTLHWLPCGVDRVLEAGSSFGSKPGWAMFLVTCMMFYIGFLSRSELFTGSRPCVALPFRLDSCLPWKCGYIHHILGVPFTQNLDR